MSQACATLDATSLNDCAASSARHALHKAVDAGAVTLLWLVRSFWHSAFTLQHKEPSDKVPLSEYSPLSAHLHNIWCYLVKITIFTL